MEASVLGKEGKGSGGDRLERQWGSDSEGPLCHGKGSGFYSEWDVHSL